MRLRPFAMVSERRNKMSCPLPLSIRPDRSAEECREAGSGLSGRTPKCRILKPKFLPVRDPLFAMAECAGYIATARKSAAALVRSARSKAARRLVKRRRSLALRVSNETEKRVVEQIRTNFVTMQEMHEAIRSEVRAECLELIRGICEEVISRELSESSTAYVRERVSTSFPQRTATPAMKILVNGVSRDELEAYSGCANQRFAIEILETLQPFEIVILTAGGSIRLHWRDHLAKILEALSRNPTEDTDQI